MLLLGTAQRHYEKCALQFFFLLQFCRYSTQKYVESNGEVSEDLRLKVMYKVEEIVTVSP